MRRVFHAIGLLLAFMAVSVLTLGLPLAKAMTATEIDREAQEALTKLYTHSETAKDFGAVAKGFLFFRMSIKPAF